jgi:hypothetical protein
MKRIVWIASYPKSGNTWFRIFLGNLISKMEKPISINNIPHSKTGSSRRALDEALGFNSTLLSHDEIDAIRPDFYRFEASKSEVMLFKKVHDAYRYVEGGQALFPSDVTIATIYIIRNPLDVCVSFANYSGTSDFNKIAVAMGNRHFELAGGPFSAKDVVRQRVMSWSDHVSSWIEAKEMKIHVVRFEDMKANPFFTFSEALRAIGLDFSEEQIAKAIDFSKFEELRDQEVHFGFREMRKPGVQFFNAGHVGSWKNRLPNEAIDRIITDHTSIMRKFGYA